jgi:serine protease Do
MKRIKKLHKLLIALVIAVAGVALFSLPEPRASAKSDPAPMLVPANFTELAKIARPGVVNIRTVKTVDGGDRMLRHFFGNPHRGPQGRDPFEEFFGPFFGQGPNRQFKQRSLGSGFVFDTDGYIVTNNHVIEGADEIRVKLANEKEYDAEIVGRDPNTDLALIKIDPPADSPLTPLPLGNSDDLQIGSWVVAIGSPFGLEQTVTAGIVSAKGRIIGSGPYDDFIQTDASINPGNSGGPLINMQGEVVGINTAIVASGQGIGFAIPIGLAQGIIEQLKTGGEVVRAWLGVAIQDLSPDLSEYYGIEDGKGALVTEVYPGDPADKAGIEPKDVIVAVGDDAVASSRELSRLIAASPVGKKTDINLIRDGRRQTVAVTLTKRDDDKIAAAQGKEINGALGLKVTGLSEETARRYGHGPDETGVLVVAVEPGGKADKAGLLEGDVIKEINRKPVADLADYEKVLKQTASDKTLQMLVKRSGAGFIVVRLEK